MANQVKVNYKKMMNQEFKKRRNRRGTDRNRTGLKQPTRIQCEPHHRIPIWPCSERGLPCHELLPVARCALTAPFHPYRPTEAGVGGLLSAALSVGLRLPGVTWRSALRSPDFPPPGASFTAKTVVDADLAATAWLTRAAG